MLTAHGWTAFEGTSVVLASYSSRSLFSLFSLCFLELINDEIDDENEDIIIDDENEEMMELIENEDSSSECGHGSHAVMIVRWSGGCDRSNQMGRWEIHHITYHICRSEKHMILHLAVQSVSSSQLLQNGHDQSHHSILVMDSFHQSWYEEWMMAMIGILWNGPFVHSMI